MNRSNPQRRREPIRGIGVKAARLVQSAIGYLHPTEIEIEIIAYMRGALVRAAHARGSRANLLRIGERGIIGVAEGLSPEERRWAIAHELGHFEAHAGVSFVGLCTSADMIAAYESSGREPEANAFAAELLLPEQLLRPRCDLPRVSWEPVCALAREFQVSATAAALRFIELTDDRVALVCAREGKVLWSAATPNFGRKPRRGSRLDEWTEANAFFRTGKASEKPETVSASSWVDECDEDEDLVEHVLAMPNRGIAMSLLWRKS